MNLLDLMIKIGVEDETAGKVEKIAGSVKGTLGSAAAAGAKAVAAAAAAVATGTAALGGKALEAYASWEQLTGGVETLFGEASGQLMAYANGAYATAGVSANAYMEQATSFAASLVSSLGGDTNAAVEYANTAITDMSDNANKMGTDIGSLQFAYQGFAKQNYTMLDNLKLGYGGTKEEMERLIADANEVKAANGEMADLSIDSFADVVEAIHIMQGEMGIAGTTAEEASTTIEGSVNAMKSAWENWLAALGNPDADMDALTQELLTCVENVITNVAPRVAEIAGKVVDELPSLVSKVSEQLGPMVTEALAGAWNTAVEAIKGIGIELPSIDSQDVKDAIDGLAGAIDTLKDNADWLVPSIGGAIGAIAGFQIASSMSAIIETLRVAITAWKAANEGLTISQILLNAAMNANPLMIVAMVIGAVVMALVTLWMTNEDFRNAVCEAWEWIKQTAEEVFGKVVEFFTVTIPEAIDQLVAWFQQLPENIATALQQMLSDVSAWATGVAQDAWNAGSQFVQNVGSFLTGLPGSVAGWLSGIISSVATWVSEMATGAWNAATEFGSSLMDGLASLPGKVAEIGGQIIQGIADGITGAASSVVSAIGDAVGGAIDWAKQLLGIASPSKVFRKFGEYSMEGMSLGIAGASSLPVRAMRDAVADVEGAAVLRTSAASSGGSGRQGDSVVGWLESNLPRIIARNTPVLGRDEIGRIVRSEVRYA